MGRSPEVPAPYNGATPRMATTEKMKNTVMQKSLLQCRYTISNVKIYVTQNFMFRLLSRGRFSGRFLFWLDLLVGAGAKWAWMKINENSASSLNGIYSASRRDERG